MRPPPQSAPVPQCVWRVPWRPRPALSCLISSLATASALPPARGWRRTHPRGGLSSPSMTWQGTASWCCPAPTTRLPVLMSNAPARCCVQAASSPTVTCSSSTSGTTRPPPRYRASPTRISRPRLAELPELGADVVRTLGSAGAAYHVCGGKCGHVPASNVAAVDSTAAGDTSLVARQLRTLPFEQRLRARRRLACRHPAGRPTIHPSPGRT
ncbi:hypothetical protein FPZ41_21790 [Streptomyces sp. K1PN6]|uniref:Uncharacterized protein n=1 Tax=Streptomyces acidicola TaxID=2596892 RepID=A0A5N8WUW4_9ACTN|nr:hypothetical protein [Streptomyces acidicola]